MHSDDELVDVFDDRLRKIGTETRYQAHLHGSWHLNVHCWVVSGRGGGSILFQLRSRKKETYPGRLDSTVGGHIRAGETVRGVVREVREEIGLKVTIDDLVFLGTRLDLGEYRGMIKKEVATVFLLRKDLLPSAYIVDPAEVYGLFEVGIQDGLRFFSKRSKQVDGVGCIWAGSPPMPMRERRRFARGDFVPKVDSYYLTLCIMAERFLAGSKYLSI